MSSEPRYFSAVSINRLYVSVQNTALPINGITNSRFRHEHSHRYIFLLTLISANLSVLFVAAVTLVIASLNIVYPFLSRLRSPISRCAKILMSVSAQCQEPPFKFGPSFCCDAARIVIPMTTSVHSPLTRRPTNSTPTYSAVR